MVSTRTHRQNLIHTHPTVTEGRRPTDQVQAPDADDLLAHQVCECGDVGLESIDPSCDRRHIVLPQRVHVPDLQACVLQQSDRLDRKSVV